MRQIRERLVEQAYLEARAMAAHALGRGRAVPPGVADTLMRMEVAGGAGVTLRELAGAHAQLAKAVAPATPELVLALQQDGAAHHRQATGQLPIVRSFMIAAGVSLVLYLGLS